MKLKTLLTAALVAAGLMGQPLRTPVPECR